MSIPRHFFLCTGKHCEGQDPEGLLWPELKRLTSELIESSEANHFCRRSQVHCLGVCQGGAVAVIYPEGVWYGGLNVESLREVVASHLAQGKPVEKHFLPEVDIPQNPKFSAPSKGLQMDIKKSK